MSVNSRSVQANSAYNPSQESTISSPGQRTVSRPDEIWPSNKDIHDRFILAVLGSFVSVLCRDEGFTPLNPRTMILNRPNSSDSGRISKTYSHSTNSITLATLDISLTSLGTLIVKVYSDTALGLQSLVNSTGSIRKSNRLSPGTLLWLAPGGGTAKFYALSNRRGLPKIQANESVTTPSDHKPNEFNETTLKAWQSKVLEWLSTKGIDISSLDNDAWLFVQMLGGNESHDHIVRTEYQDTFIPNGSSVVPWPALLCFSSSNSATQGPLACGKL